MTSARRWWLGTAACVALTALCVLLVDHPVAAALGPHPAGAEVWNQLLSGVEVLVGIEPWIWLVPVALGVWILATRCSRPALFVTLGYLLSRNLMLWGKLATGRLRPHQWTSGGTFFRHGESFPSGHIVFVAGLIVPLVVVFPRLRPLLALVVVVGAARIAVNAHWVSDVIGGAATVAFSTALCLPLLRGRQ